jgi:WD40 repeat protein
MTFSATKQHTFSGHVGPVYTIAKGVNAHEIISGSSDQRIGSWNLQSGQPGSFSANMPTHLLALCSIPERNIIIAGTSGGTVHFLDLAEKKEVKAEKYFDSQVFEIEYSAKHQLLLITSGDGRVVVSDSLSFEKLKQLQICNEKVRSVAIHPDGNSVAIASSDGRVRIFSLPLMKETHNFIAHDLAANVACWHPQGKYLVTGGRDAYLNTWDPANNFESIQKIAAHNYAIYSISFSPDGKYFATGSRDKTVKLWDAESIQLLLRINKEKQDGHLNSVNKVLWTEDGLVSTGDDRLIILWKIVADH